MRPEERFWNKVHKTSTCWLWMGALDRKGYGVLGIKGKQWKAHRFAYELLVGPIPDGLTLDHVRANGCTNKNCVNPAHLSPVTSGENVLRGDAPPALNARKTHCKNGHLLAGDNLLYHPSQRRCRICNRERARAYDRQRRAERSN